MHVTWSHEINFITQAQLQISHLKQYVLKLDARILLVFHDGLILDWFLQLF